MYWVESELHVSRVSSPLFFSSFAFCPDCILFGVNQINWTDWSEGNPADRVGPLDFDESLVLFLPVFSFEFLPSPIQISFHSLLVFQRRLRKSLDGIHSDGIRTVEGCEQGLLCAQFAHWDHSHRTPGASNHYLLGQFQRTLLPH